MYFYFFWSKFIGICKIYNSVEYFFHLKPLRILTRLRCYVWGWTVWPGKLASVCPKTMSTALSSLYLGGIQLVPSFSERSSIAHGTVARRWAAISRYWAMALIRSGSLSAMSLFASWNYFFIFFCWSITELTRCFCRMLCCFRSRST